MTQIQNEPFIDRRKCALDFMNDLAIQTAKQCDKEDGYIRHQMVVDPNTNKTVLEMQHSNGYDIGDTFWITLEKRYWSFANIIKVTNKATGEDLYMEANHNLLCAWLMF
jgi:hypothetical protein